MRYKLKFVNVQEVWYQKEPIDKNVDLVFYHQVSFSNGKSEKFYTLLLDLKNSEETIYNSFVKNNKYEINRAITKDNLSFSIFQEDLSQDVLKRFSHAYNDFAAERNRDGIKSSDFENYMKNGNLAISMINDENGLELVWHTYLIKDGRVRLKTSNSIFANENNETKNLVGRANRLLHWKDIQFFKNKGYTLYDFGGWYAGESNTKLLGINKFKESFGGYKEESYNHTQAISLKGNIFLMLNNLKTKISRK